MFCPSPYNRCPRPDIRTGVTDRNTPTLSKVRPPLPSPSRYSRIIHDTKILHVSYNYITNTNHLTNNSYSSQHRHAQQGHYPQGELCSTPSGLTPKHSKYNPTTNQHKLPFKVTKMVHCFPFPSRKGVQFTNSPMAGFLPLPQEGPGKLHEVDAWCNGEFFSALMDIRGIPNYQGTTHTEIKQGSTIPGQSGNGRYVCIHNHGRRSLQDKTVYARPAKNIARDIVGLPPYSRTLQRPQPDQPTPRTSKRMMAFPKGGDRPPPITNDTIRSFLAQSIGRGLAATDPQSATIRKLKSDNIVLQAFDRDGFPDEALLFDDKPTTFFLRLNTDEDSEAISTICNNRELRFRLHLEGKTLSFKNWILENPESGHEFGPAAASALTLYTTFTLTTCLTQEQETESDATEQVFSLLLDVNSDHLARVKLHLITQILHMARAAAVPQDHPFAQFQLLCEEVCKYWNFTYITHHGTSSETVQRCNRFALAIQLSSPEDSDGLLNCSPISIPVVSELGPSILTIQMFEDNPTTPQTDTHLPNDSPDLPLLNESEFKAHSIHITSYKPLPPDIITSSWQEELLRRIQKNTSPDNPPSPDPAINSMCQALVGTASINLIKVRVSANIQVLKPYRIDSRSSSGGKTKRLTVAPVNARVLQFALSNLGSARFYCLPPPTPSDPIPTKTTLLVGTFGVSINGSKTTPPLSHLASPRDKNKLTTDLGKLFSDEPPINPPTPHTPAQAPSYAKLFHTAPHMAESSQTQERRAANAMEDEQTPPNPATAKDKAPMPNPQANSPPQICQTYSVPLLPHPSTKNSPILSRYRHREWISWRTSSDNRWSYSTSNNSRPSSPSNSRRPTPDINRRNLSTSNSFWSGPLHKTQSWKRPIKRWPSAWPHSLTPTQQQPSLRHSPLTHLSPLTHPTWIKNTRPAARDRNIQLKTATSLMRIWRTRRRHTTLRRNRTPMTTSDQTLWIDLTIRNQNRRTLVTLLTPVRTYLQLHPDPLLECEMNIFINKSPFPHTQTAVVPHNPWETHTTNRNSGKSHPLTPHKIFELTLSLRTQGTHQNTYQHLLLHDHCPPITRPLNLNTKPDNHVPKNQWKPSPQYTEKRVTHTSYQHTLRHPPPPPTENVRLKNQHWMLYKSSSDTNVMDETLGKLRYLKSLTTEYQILHWQTTMSSKQKYMILDADQHPLYAETTRSRTLQDKATDKTSNLNRYSNKSIVFKTKSTEGRVTGTDYTNESLPRVTDATQHIHLKATYLMVSQSPYQIVDYEETIKPLFRTVTNIVQTCKTKITNQSESQYSRSPSFPQTTHLRAVCVTEHPHGTDSKIVPMRPFNNTLVQIIRICSIKTINQQILNYTSLLPTTKYIYLTITRSIFPRYYKLVNIEQHRTLISTQPIIRSLKTLGKIVRACSIKTLTQPVLTHISLYPLNSTMLKGGRDETLPLPLLLSLVYVLLILYDPPKYHFRINSHNTKRKRQPIAIPRYIRFPKKRTTVPITRNTVTPIQSWLNTLPDRFGSLVIPVPDRPWPKMAIRAPVWQPRPAYKTQPPKLYSKVQKRTWVTYVKNSNRIHMYSFYLLLKPIILNPFFPLRNFLSKNPTQILDDVDKLITDITTDIILTILLQSYISVNTTKKLLTITLADPRNIILMLLMCAGDIHPNPGPLPTVDDMKQLYEHRTPEELTSWIRDSKGPIYFAATGLLTSRNDILSGFYQEYLDKSDQNTLVTKTIQATHTLFPHLPLNSVRVVNAAEEHELSRGEIPFNWLNPDLCTGTRTKARGQMMSDPLGGIALVIPRVHQAHFTTYVITQEGVHFYDSLAGEPDLTITQNYHTALLSYYELNHIQSTNSIKETLNNITSVPPACKSCTYQNENPIWSCGYCSANVCLQAVLQQTAPVINQPLTDIYKLQDAFLNYKITLRQDGYYNAVIALASLTCNSQENTPSPSRNPKTLQQNKYSNDFNSNQQKSIQQSKISSYSDPPYTCNTTPNILQKIKTSTITTKRTNLYNTKAAPKKQRLPYTAQTQSVHSPLLDIHQQSSPDIQPGPPCPQKHSDFQSADPNSLQQPQPQPTLQTHKTRAFSKPQKDALTKARKRATKRINKLHKKERQHPMTKYIKYKPQSLAVMRNPTHRSKKKFIPNNLFTCGYSTKTNTCLTQTKQLPPRSEQEQMNRDIMHSDPLLSEFCPQYPSPPSPNSLQGSTPEKSPPKQQQPIEEILHTHARLTPPETPRQGRSYVEKSETPINRMDSPPITICTFNVCKGGEDGLALTDLEHIIDSDSPDVLLLTETPFKNSSKPLTKIITRRGYKYVFFPTPTPSPDQSFLPPEARLPKRTLKKSTGGAMCAYKKNAPWAHWTTTHKIPHKELKSYIAAIEIQQPGTPPRIIAATCIPHKNPAIKEQIWSYLHILQEHSPAFDVLVGGDFQENIHLQKSTPQKLQMVPIGKPSPTFCPSHAPNINTTIDGFLTIKKTDPWADDIHNVVEHIDSAYADHHALLLTVKQAGFPVIQKPIKSQRPRSRNLRLPLKQNYVEEWQAAIRQQLSYSIYELMERASQILDRYPDPEDRRWEQKEQTQETEHLATQLTEILSSAAELAHEIMPHNPAPAPPQTDNDRPRWSSHMTQKIKDAAQRSRLLRKFNNQNRRINTTQNTLNNLHLDMAAFPIDTEFETGLDLNPPTNLTTEVSDEITRIIASHKTYSKRIVRAAKKENSKKYSEHLENLFKTKPKKALETVINSCKTGKQKQFLNVVQDTELHVLHTDPHDCIQAITREQTANLSSTVPTEPREPYPWETLNCPDPFILTRPGNTPDTILHTITKADYDQCVKECNGQKATGPDNVPGELIKHLPHEFHEAIYKVFNLMTRSKVTPTQWLQSQTVLIYKKGDPTLMDNYRPIALANHL